MTRTNLLTTLILIIFKYAHMQTSIAYNENQVKYDDTKEDTKNGFKL